MARENILTRIEMVIVVAIVLLLATIAVPGLRRSRMLGNESAAIAGLRAIHSAETAYASTCGQNRYAASLTTLGTRAPGAPDGFLAADLATASPRTGGFRYSLGAGEGAIAGAPDCNGKETVTGYYAAAEPLEFGATGARSFAVNTAGMVWQARAAAAPAEPFAAPSTPIQ
jgi:type II secretory pathway pseudopilin PulG